MGMCCETRRPRRQRRWTSLTRMDSSFQLLTRATSLGLVIGDGVDERRTPPTVGCRTRETERRVKKDAARPRVIRWGIDSRGAATEGAAGLRPHRRPAHGRKTQLSPGRRTSLGGELRDVKRPASFQRQTGACRSCGLAVSQPRRGHEEPVEATDALRPTGGGRSAESGPSQLPGGGSDPLRPPDQCPATEAINLNRQTGVQRPKRSTSTARPVSSDRSDQLRFARRVSSGRRA